jgi:hypothetical protein
MAGDRSSLSIIAREGGRSSRHRRLAFYEHLGVLDAPPARGMTSGGWLVLAIDAGPRYDPTMGTARSTRAQNGNAGAAAPLRATSHHIVMAGLVPAIHVDQHVRPSVDARDKPGHDDGENVGLI